MGGMGAPGMPVPDVAGQKKPRQELVWLTGGAKEGRVDGFRLELMEESDVVVVEESEVVDGVADHGESLDAQSEGEA